MKSLSFEEHLTRVFYFEIYVFRDMFYVFDFEKVKALGLKEDKLKKEVVYLLTVFYVWFIFNYNLKSERVDKLVILSYNIL